jgi:hypothetical protein
MSLEFLYLQFEGLPAELNEYIGTFLCDHWFEDPTEKNVTIRDCYDCTIREVFAEFLSGKFIFYAPFELDEDSGIECCGQAKAHGHYYNELGCYYCLDGNEDMRETEMVLHYLKKCDLDCGYCNNIRTHKDYGMRARAKNWVKHDLHECEEEECELCDSAHYYRREDNWILKLTRHPAPIPKLITLKEPETPSYSYISMFLNIANALCLYEDPSDEM